MAVGGATHQLARFVTSGTGDGYPLAECINLLSGMDFVGGVLFALAVWISQGLGNST